MRIGIDLACWANRRGYGRYTRNLVRALVAAPGPHEMVLFVDAPTASRGGLPADAEIVVVKTRVAPAEAASASGRRSGGDLWAFRRAMARTPHDVLWIPSVYTYVPPPPRTPVLLGVHDTIAEDHPDLVFPQRRQRWLWTLKSRLAHRRADAILAVSDHARTAIARHFGHPPERIFVVEEAPDPVFRRLPPEERDAALLPSLGLPRTLRFLLYLGGVNPHKNLSRLVEALGLLRARPAFRTLHLVIVGDLEDGFTPGWKPLRARIDHLGLSDAVHVTGYLGDDDVVQLMNRADALALPSLAEGFGLPAVEAAACGTPVVATRNSPLPALLAGGGRFVDPTSTAGIGEAIAAVIGDEAVRRRLGDTARRRASRLSWDRAASQLVAVLATVAEGAGGPRRRPDDP